MFLREETTDKLLAEHVHVGNYVPSVGDFVQFNSKMYVVTKRVFNLDEGQVWRAGLIVKLQS